MMRLQVKLPKFGLWLANHHTVHTVILYLFGYLRFGYTVDDILWTYLPTHCSVFIFICLFPIFLLHLFISSLLPT